MSSIYENVMKKENSNKINNSFYLAK
jgi:hypothetical protein